MPWRLQGQPTTVEKICAGLSYLTFGIAGLLYTVLSKSGNQSQLFRFHFMQSIMLWILATLLGWGSGPLVEIVAAIMKGVASGALPGFLLGYGIVVNILTYSFYLLLIYGAVLAFLGKSAEVPFISNLVRQNMR